MKKMLPILILSLYLTGCGSTSTPVKKIKPITVDEVINSVKIIKSKFDKNATYTTPFWCESSIGYTKESKPCSNFPKSNSIDYYYGYTSINGKYLIRGWKEDNNSFSHQVYIEDLLKYKSKSIKDQGFYSANLLGGEEVAITKIDSDRKCAWEMYELQQSVNRMTSGPYSYNDGADCYSTKTIGISMTSEKLRKYRGTGVEIRLNGKGGKKYLDIPSILVDGYLKALGL
jgi:hypothetical protein